MYMYDIRDSMASLFLVLALAVALPLTIAAVVLALIGKRKSKIAVIGFAVIAVLLVIGTLVNGLIGLNRGDFYDGRMHHHPCTWVELGLCCGALTIALLIFIGALISVLKPNKEKQEEDEQLDVVVSTRLDGDFVFVTACANCGIGLWTSICVSFAGIMGVESKNYTKKLNRVLTAVRRKLEEVAKANPEYEFRDFRVVKEGAVAYTGTMMGVKKK